jgi:hypothetical protein
VAAKWETAQGEGGQERGGWVGEIMICGGLGFSLMWGAFCSQATNLSIDLKS